MKLVVQIPCFNEEKTLPLVINSIPKKIKGIDSIEILVVDDGSTDSTVEIAKQNGVKHIVYHKKNMGLARSFHDGINYALGIGADIVVNTDGDNQHPQEKIAELVQPIIKGTAEIVIGDRQTASHEEFTFFKKTMQKFGTWVVNKAANTNLPDAASGFRAYSKEALMRLNIITQFSYCMETIIQAGNKRIPIESIKIKTNPKTRESRLFKNIWQHMFMSASAIIRSFIMFRPHLVFITSGVILSLFGSSIFIRYCVLYFIGDKGSHIQSLILGAVFFVAAIISFALSILADLSRTNRILQEDVLERIKRQQFQEKILK